ncbi:copper amine oxidase N-terminal domain-containing protein [Petrocella sp. FN5]|uniref:copper amine oxidase N-terminal domain-containing protein n=1 Tax=Petrocella sp. FN5 TaxID=3032002 RepID=UPI0023DB0A88|nr:copper amine oxidase N-terminal domain-containing protein [Petrocella sp. FN5]MDF1617177.1 copper amine oxidase N-terminal domain-containing protein [Petrocella sp. FN5]
MKKISTLLLLITCMSLGTITSAFAQSHPNNETPISVATEIQVIEGITMIPLRKTLEAFGYQFIWHEASKRVDLSKGPLWTSIAIGENAYFRQKMAPWALSRAPIILDGHTWVPIEFLSEITSLGIEIENETLKVTQSEPTFHEGFIKEITSDDQGNLSFSIVQDLEEKDYANRIVIHTSEKTTIFQVDIQENDTVKVISPNFSTLSLPPQTPGYIIY